MSDESSKMSSEKHQFNWTDELTDLFVDQCYKFKDRFRIPNLKGAVLWTDILEHFLSLGHPVTLGILMRKFSNMKTTYGRIVKAGHQNKTKWPYFDKFDEIVDDVDIEWSKNDEPVKTIREKRPTATVVEFHWNHESTSLLLQEYLERLSSFRDPKARKKELWDEIRDIFEENGFKISSDLLDRKFRSLRNRFLELQSSHNSDKTAWSYYKSFEKICENQNQVFDAVQPKKEVIYMENHDEMYEDAANSEGNYCHSEREFADEIDDEGAPLTKRLKTEHREDYYEQKLEIERRKVEELAKIRQNMAEQNQIMREFLEIMKRKAMS
ncbi:uncharacterized protein LOC134831561 [Culicoides brevitarsis]|uniref:uncharacterized protein LOC134831561 n=1 Tax=Culicoides brevitarsis TaxID=469753 RepID=UPI00307B7936